MAIRLTEQEIQERFSKKKKEHDFFDICNQIKSVMDAGLKNLKDSGLNNSSETDDEELDNYLKDLNKRSERVSDKFVKGLGQMYKGVLVRGELSVRENGGVYAYRCQYRMDCEQVSKMLLAHKDNVIQNMGDEKSKIIFEVIDKLYPRDEKGYIKHSLNIDTSIASGEEQIKPFNIFDFEKKSYSDDTYVNQGNMLRVSKMTFNRGRITFETDGGSSVGNRIIHKLCLAKHQDVIAEIRNRIVNELQSRKNELQEAEDVVDNLLGKYLIAAELSA